MKEGGAELEAAFPPHPGPAAGLQPTGRSHLAGIGLRKVLTRCTWRSLAPPPAAFCSGLLMEGFLATSSASEPSPHFADEFSPHLHHIDEIYAVAGEEVFQSLGGL